MALLEMDGKYYDMDTSNKQFLEISEMFKDKGIKNSKFMLELKNPDLYGIDPFDMFLDDKTKLAILQECKENVFYFLRELIRIPNPDGSVSQYYPTEENMTQAYCASNRFDTVVEGRRQTYKTVSVACFLLWVMVFQTNQNINVISHSFDSSKHVLITVRNIYRKLPLYAQIGTMETSETVETFSNEVAKNKMTAVKLPVVVTDSEDKETEKLYLKKFCENCNRLTPTIEFIDDMEFVPYCYTLLRETAAGFHYASQNIKYGKTYNTEEGKIERIDKGLVFCRICVNTKDPSEPEHNLPTKEQREDKRSFERRVMQWDPFYFDITLQELHAMVDEEIKIGFNGFIGIGTRRLV